VVLVLVLTGVVARAADWPQLHGPTRNGQSSEANLTWDQQGPKLLWKVEVGAGFAGPAVRENIVYLTHRIEENDHLTAYSAAEGKTLWDVTWKTKFRDQYRVGDGPRCTPVIHDGKIFVLSSDGQLHCVGESNGRKIWNRDLAKEYQPPEGFFGIGANPAVVQGKLIVMVGARGASLVAFDLATGKELWKSGNDAASYSQITEMTVQGKVSIVAWTREAVVIVDPANGKELARHPFRSRLEASVNAATPIVQDNELFLTASYGTGATLLKFEKGQLEELWQGDRSLSSQFNTPVKIGDQLFGIDGRQEGNSARLRCVDWSTGKVRWTQEKVGCAHVIALPDAILVLRETGELLRVAINTQNYQELGKAELCEGTVRAAPALSNGRFILRNESTLAVYQLVSRPRKN
jgi:outer membrane protein assembly factor BamB